jgi:hypothetical protein
MRKTLSYLLIAIFCTLPNIGCTPCKNMGFERFQRATRVEITTNHNQVLRNIEKLADVRALVEFTQAYKDGWSTPWAGAPIAPVRVNFYQREQFLGDFGIGEGFLAAQGCGGFQSRSISSEERARLIQLFGVSVVP